MAAEVIQGLYSYFTFRIGNELLAVNIGHITKILEMTDITKVPNSPRYFKGIINLFGEVLPVFDGRLKLGFPEAERTRNTCILIFVFEMDGQPVSSGLVVDSVGKVVIFDADQIKPVQQNEEGFNSEYIDGIASINNESVIILNLEKVFAEDEISLKNAVD
jgi:purine-binding chemotaxis protein CheW